MATQLNTNMEAVAIPATIERNNSRLYLALVADTAVVVTLSAGAPFTVPAGSVWAPVPAPTNDIAFSGTGTLVLG